MSGTRVMDAVSTRSRARELDRSWRVSRTPSLTWGGRSGHPRTPPPDDAAGLRITASQVERLEGEIDALQRNHLALTSFVLRAVRQPRQALHLDRNSLPERRTFGGGLCPGRRRRRRREALTLSSTECPTCYSSPSVRQRWAWRRAMRPPGANRPDRRRATRAQSPVR